MILSKLLIVTHESVGEKMAGPGMRAWEMARALGKLGVQITLATPFPSLRQTMNVRVVEFAWEDSSSLDTLLKTHQVVLGIGPVITRIVHRLGHPIDIPTIVDLYDVSEIERIWLHLSIWHYDFEPTPVYTNQLFTYLRQGDFFVCASEKQFDFWLGALLAVGRLNSATLGVDYNVNHLIDIVPFGLPDEPPVTGPNVLKGVVPGIGVQDKIIYWSGGVWDWTDPITLMNALKIILRNRDDIRVVFAGVRHFDQRIVGGMSVATRLMDVVRQENWLDKYVFFQDWVPYDQRGAYLLEADVGVSLNIRSIENRYAARARLLDYLWTQLPCVLSRGDGLSDLLEEAGLAYLVNSGDERQVAECILRILHQTQARDRADMSLLSYAERFRWSVVIEPILGFLREPRQAPDAQESRSKLHELIPLHTEWEQLLANNRTLEAHTRTLEAHTRTLEAQNYALKEEIERFRNRRAIRWADGLSRLLGKMQHG